MSALDAAALRAEFPVLAGVAYLNAGTDGPLPARAGAAACAELERQQSLGRAQSHFERRRELTASLREVYAGVLRCAPQELALTTSTTEGMGTVVAGLELGPGDEILTGDEEHPGLLGSLIAAREARGVSIRVAPLPDLVQAVGPRTRLVACSHVSWMSGGCAPGALAELDVPVVLDGAQGAGAIPVDVRALGCDAYAAAGQKWLCGPDGTGMLYVSPRFGERLLLTRCGYGNLDDASGGLDARPRDDAARFDTASLSAEALACACAAASVLARAGWREVHARARDLARELAERLAAVGRGVVPRGETTLVSFASPDPVT